MKKIVKLVFILIVFFAPVVVNAQSSSAQKLYQEGVSLYNTGVKKGPLTEGKNSLVKAKKMFENAMNLDKNPKLQKNCKLYVSKIVKSLKGYPCTEEECDSVFKTKEELAQHIVWMHTPQIDTLSVSAVVAGEKSDSIECDIQGKSASFKIETNVKDGWKASVGDNADNWVILKKDDAKSLLTVEIKRNETTLLRHAYVDIKAGDLTPHTIHIAQKGKPVELSSNSIVRSRFGKIHDPGEKEVKYNQKDDCFELKKSEDISVFIEVSCNSDSIYDEKGTNWYVYSAGDVQYKIENTHKDERTQRDVFCLQLDFPKIKFPQKEREIWIKSQDQDLKFKFRQK